ncbi:MAG: FCD domain-containing protein [Roseobacter sp.]
MRRWVRESYPETGSRLPPERELAQTLHISRPELRKSLAMLEAEGIISRQVGRGTFVSEPPAVVHASNLLADLTERTGPHDAMTARLVLEPELAGMAALHASARQVREMQEIGAKIRAAKTWDEYERLDFDLHDLIAKSSGNMLLHELHKIMNSVRHVVVWRNLSLDIDRPALDYHSFDEHDAIIEAIASQNCITAKEHMRAHLQATLETMTS